MNFFPDRPYASRGGHQGSYRRSFGQSHQQQNAFSNTPRTNRRGQSIAVNHPFGYVSSNRSGCDGTHQSSFMLAQSFDSTVINPEWVDNENEIEKSRSADAPAVADSTVSVTASVAQGLSTDPFAKNSDEFAASRQSATQKVLPNRPLYDEQKTDTNEQNRMSSIPVDPDQSRRQAFGSYNQQTNQQGYVPANGITPPSIRSPFGGYKQANHRTTSASANQPTQSSFGRPAFSQPMNQQGRTTPVLSNEPSSELPPFGSHPRARQHIASIEDTLRPKAPPNTPFYGENVARKQDAQKAMSKDFSNVVFPGFSANEGVPPNSSDITETNRLPAFNSSNEAPTRPIPVVPPVLSTPSSNAYVELNRTPISSTRGSYGGGGFKPQVGTKLRSFEHQIVPSQTNTDTISLGGTADALPSEMVKDVIAFNQVDLKNIIGILDNVRAEFNKLIATIEGVATRS